MTMNFLYSLNQLYGNHQDSFDGKSPVTKIEQVLQIWTEKIKNHGIVSSTFSVIMNLRKRWILAKLLVKFKLKKKLWNLRVDWF